MREERSERGQYMNEYLDHGVGDFSPKEVRKYFEEIEGPTSSLKDHVVLETYQRDVNRCCRPPSYTFKWWKENVMDDFNIRSNYAAAVAGSLQLTDYSKTLFMGLRIAKVWNYTNDMVKFHKLLILLEKLPTDEMGVWGISSKTAGSLVQKLRLDQTERLLKLLVLSNNGAICLSQTHFNYQNGFHFGEWVADVVKGIRKQHRKYFNTFMRVFRYTHKINTHFSGRYLRVFDKMPENELMLTTTDKRNWKGKFRLAVIVKNVEDWQPLRLNHKKDKIWLKKFKRVPKNRNIWGLPDLLIKGINKKKFSLFIKEYKKWGSAEQNDPHKVLAMAKLIMWFGQDWYQYKKDTGVSTHDAGINLPNMRNDEAAKFLKRYAHEFGHAQRIVHNWAYILEQGVNPLSKNGLALSKAVCQSLVFDNVVDHAFAQECAKWTTDQSAFIEWQQIWLSHKDVMFETIPKVIVSKGDWKFYKLDRDDPRGPFLGNYTGCCQHPNGAGASCAKYGVVSPYSGFVVLEHRGDIKYQSWIWRKSDTLVFDSIEGLSDMKANAKDIYLEGIHSFKGGLGINRILVGTGYGSIHFNKCVTLDNPVELPGGYSDAHQVWEIISPPEVFQEDEIDF